MIDPIATCRAELHASFSLLNTKTPMMTIAILTE